MPLGSGRTAKRIVVSSRRLGGATRADTTRSPGPMQGLLDGSKNPSIWPESALFDTQSAGEMPLVPAESILYYPAIVRGSPGPPESVNTYLLILYVLRITVRQSFLLGN